MDRVKRRLLLTMAALSPGVVTITLQEFAVSMAFMVLGLFGAVSVAAATVAIFPQIIPNAHESTQKKQGYASLLMASAFNNLRDTAPDPIFIRATLTTLMLPGQSAPGFVTEDEQVTMVLAQIMARWDVTDVVRLTDDQARELWLVERLLRATPAEAGVLSQYFAAPNAMLTMRDTLAAPVSATAEPVSAA